MKKPVVKLIGEDGNIFSIVSRVSRVLERNGMKDKAEEYIDRVWDCNSYDEALMVTREYVEVK